MTASITGKLRFVLGLLLFCGLYWVLDSLWSYWSFEQNVNALIFHEPLSYWDTLRLNVSPYQAVSRIMVTVLFIVSGSVVAILFNRQKLAKEGLKDSEARYRSLTENFPDGALVLFDSQYRCLVANGKAFSQLGLPSDRVVGKTIKEAFPNHWESILPNLKTALQGRGTNFTLSLKGRTYSNQVLPITNEQGNVIGQGIIIARDITEQMRLQEEKAKIESQYYQAQKVEAIGRLAGGVAHDLNNLLLPIIGYGEILLLDSQFDEAAAETLNQIVKAGLRARDLVGQLLAFSRKQTLDYKSVDLNKTIVGFEKLLRRTVREDIEIDMVLAPSIPTIKADSGQLEQVLMNLVINAQDAMLDGGKLTIETGRAVLDEHYAATHADVAPGEYVVLSITDTGFGMDAETREKIFEPFFSTKGEEGTGLGLATVYGIIAQHGGNIWVYSEPGQGACFKIYLPVPEQMRMEPDPDTKPVTSLQGSETILLVEDNDQVRKLAALLLQRYGYTIIQASSGESALQILERKNSRPDLLLTDVVMPGMNGRELYERAVRHYPGLKVLYMSGYTDNVIAHRGVLEEGIFFIQKPFTALGLATKVRQTLGY